MDKSPEAFRTISEVAEDLDLPQHVLRFWETRFNQIRPMKRGGGRRYYRPEDVELLRGVRRLLYGEGFTIRGVQRLLKDKGVAFVVAAGQPGAINTLAPAPEDEGEATPTARHERREPPMANVKAAEPSTTPGELEPEPAPMAAVAPPPPPVTVIRLALGEERRRRMEGALADLLEAKRLLEQAR